MPAHSNQSAGSNQSNQTKVKPHQLEVILKINGKEMLISQSQMARMPQTWFPIPTIPVTLSKECLTKGVPLHRENSPSWNQRFARLPPKFPRRGKVKEVLVHTTWDLPNCWQVCCNVPKALFLILQKLMSSQSRSLQRKAKKAWEAARATSPLFSAANL